MRNKALIVIGALLFLLGQVGVNYLIYKYKNNIELPKVELEDKEEKKDNNSFAIMLEQDDGTYTQTDSNSFNQLGYVFNTDKSGCMDINGNMIENSISYNDTTKAVVVKVNSTAYCYVYFDKPNLYNVCGSNTMSDCVSNGWLETVTDIWESGLEGDGYRYTGTNPDNYICFGTTDTSTCTGNTDAYMYRIIGVFKDSSGNSYMKLIKKEALNSTIAWNSSNSNIDWGSSTLYSALNGSTFLTNTTYVPSGWSDRIATWSWTATNTQTDYIGSSTSNTGVYYYYSTGAGIYNSEHQVNTTTGCYNSISGSSINCYSTAAYTTVSAKIGLMYASDYVLAGGSNYVSTKNSSNYSSLKTDSWMFITNSDSGAPSSYEWTMSRYGYISSDSGYRAWRVYSDGGLGWSYVAYTYSVRPVFYLTSSQVIASGTGTSSDPYILN